MNTYPPMAWIVQLTFPLVAQSCPTLCDLMDCSPSGFSVHGDSLGKNTGVGCHDYNGYLYYHVSVHLLLYPSSKASFLMQFIFYGKHQYTSFPQNTSLLIVK